MEVNIKMLNNDQLNVGVKFKGNVNGVICEIIKIENPVTSYKTDWKGDNEPIRTSSAKTAIIKDCKTGHTFQYGLEALKRCDITILE